jgi:hypothetical protein
VVVDLAFYQRGAGRVHLGEEFHHSGLALACAQIGRVPRGMADTWPRQALAAVTLDFLREHGPALRAHAISDVVAFDDGPALLAELVSAGGPVRRCRRSCAWTHLTSRPAAGGAAGEGGARARRRDGSRRPELLPLFMRMREAVIPHAIYRRGRRYPRTHRRRTTIKRHG